MTDAVLRTRAVPADGPAPSAKAAPARPGAPSTTRRPWRTEALWAKPTLSGSLVTLALTGTSGLLYVLCLPAFSLSWLGWVATAGWMALLTLERRLSWVDYAIVYATGAVTWSSVFWWFAIPHPAGIPGVVVIGLYFGWYMVALTLIGRELVRRWRMPVVLAGPIVWVTVELVRGTMFTGLSMGVLAHSQVDFLPVIQIADLGGGYAVGAVMVTVAAGLVAIVRGDGLASRAGQPAFAGLLVAATFGYGQWRLAQDPVDASRPPLKALVIQGCIDTIFGPGAPTPRDFFDHYEGLTRDARRAHPDATVVLWPEGMMPVPLLVDRAGRIDLTPDDRAVYQAATGYDPYRPASGANNHDVTMVVGLNAFVFPEVPIARGTAEADGPRPRPIGVFNSAAQIDPAGNVVGLYHKRHLVMFGEYLPLAELAPIFYYLTPTGGPLSTGDRFTVLGVDGYRLAPSICFESTVPHLISAQVRELAAQGEKPDVLVNLANDGNFFGSPALDLHLASNILRSVENRTPTLVAANTGFSAHIDGNGRVLRRGARHAADPFAADVVADTRTSFYTRAGDVGAWGAFLISLIAITGVLIRKTSTGRRPW